MPNTRDLSELAKHMAWADAVAWRAVLGCNAAGNDERIRQWLYHIHVVQRAFLLAWRGEEINLPEPTDFPDIPSLASWGQHGHAEIKSWLATASQNQLDQHLRVPWSAQVEAVWQSQLSDPTVGQTALQVALHTSHHRGQINARVRDLGGSPDYTDFIIWLWRGQPEPDWSFLQHQLPDA